MVRPVRGGGCRVHCRAGRAAGRPGRRAPGCLRPRRGRGRLCQLRAGLAARAAGDVCTRCSSARRSPAPGWTLLTAGITELLPAANVTRLVRSRGRSSRSSAGPPERSPSPGDDLRPDPSARPGLVRSGGPRKGAGPANPAKVTAIGVFATGPLSRHRRSPPGRSASSGDSAGSGSAIPSATGCASPPVPHHSARRPWKPRSLLATALTRVRCTVALTQLAEAEIR